MLTLSIGGRLRRIGVSSMSKSDGLHRRILTVHPSFPSSGNGGDSQQLDITSSLIRKRMDTNGGRLACGVEVRASNS
jgi:hypothetical protein